MLVCKLIQVYPGYTIKPDLIKIGQKLLSYRTHTYIQMLSNLVLATVDIKMPEKIDPGFRSLCVTYFQIGKSKKISM